MTTPAPSPAPDNAGPTPDDIVIKGRIGTDPEELARWARHVVDDRKPIEDMEIADLRLLIEAVQARASEPKPDGSGTYGKLAPPWKRGDASPSKEALEGVTHLRIEGGRVLDCDYAKITQDDHTAQALQICVMLSARCRFDEDVWFNEVSFAGVAGFHGSRFAGRATFDGASFAADAEFGCASFGEIAAFDDVSFAADAGFFGASFDGAAEFRAASFAGDTAFRAASFVEHAEFSKVNFKGGVSFLGASFAGQAWFCDTTFMQSAGFTGADFGEHVAFDGAHFAGDAWFDSTFAMTACFTRASFAGSVDGDLRTCTVENARALRTDNGRDFASQSGPVATAPLQRAHARLSEFLRDQMGWHRVRVLWRLRVLNHASLIALIVAPLLASAYESLRVLLHESKASGSIDKAPEWLRFFVRLLGDDPHLGTSLALSFFAAASITLGNFIFQIAAPDEIEKRDEEAHVRDIEARYPEGSALRNHGLRRALERIGDQAKKRPNRHESFVQHHGELIWLPPRDKLEWFDDDTLPKAEDVQRSIARAQLATELGEDATEEHVAERAKTIKFIDPKQRDGFVPGQQRAHICIEQGARAEYWLRARTKLGWAWASLLFYLLGIGLLLWILILQGWQVLSAAWLR